MSRRTERINRLLRETISELLQRQVKDPRLGGFITVTEVDTASDLSYARVCVSIMGNEIEKRRTLETLNAASGFFRKELGAQLRLRHIPDLSFRRDDSIEQGAHVLELIRQIADEGKSPKQDEN